MKILFLVPYPPGVAPSQRFRFEQYLALLNEESYKFTIKPFLDAEGWKVFYTGKTVVIILHLLKGFIKRTYHMLLATKYDFIFIHREITPLGPPVYEWLLAKFLRKKIVYDFDDAIWLEDPNEKGSWLSKLKWKKKIKSICKWSYKISAGNQFLANYAKELNSNVVINPTTIDSNSLHNPDLHPNIDNDNKPICIGWTGTHSTLQYLSEIIPILKKLQETHPFNFRIISNKRPPLELTNIEFIKWSKSTEIEDLMAIDIGIMPLTDDQWSKGKCGFKALQYMALEKPALVSPVGVNTQIVEHGENGYHCKNEDDWFNYLSFLLKNPSVCQAMGQKGRILVKENYSLESNSSNFLELFDLP
ncbi:MAG: glycosyltransferase family 4 protein [Bacteroidota bacterium]